LYQVNTRVWLRTVPHTRSSRDLSDVPDDAFDDFARQGFDWIWLLSVWRTGAAAQAVSRANPGGGANSNRRGPHRRRYRRIRLRDCGLHRASGSRRRAALGRLRERLRQRGLKLMLDFVPNHMGLDHPWIGSILNTSSAAARLTLPARRGYFRVATTNGAGIRSRSRSVFSWLFDTIQLNYGNPALCDAMIRTGVHRRRAMACAVTWRCSRCRVFDELGIESQPFWPRAIPCIRDLAPDFVFLAEVYWDLEWTLQQQGFDYCYDKRLYDRLRDGRARPVGEHLCADRTYQNRLARFLENHDEPRAAATFDFAKHRAAAVVTFLAPGLHFFHQGQFEGRRKRISPHLVRAPAEPTDRALSQFYARLLAALRHPAVREGNWQLLHCRPASGGNRTDDSFIAFAWEKSPAERLIAVVNFSDHRSQTRLHLPFAISHREELSFQDLLGNAAAYHLRGSELANGLSIDLPAWGTHAFSITILP
jgi:hypothetical protein